MTPRGEETLARLASWMPYAPAQELLQDLLGMQVSKATARRATLQTGQAALAVCEVPQAPAGAPQASDEWRWSFCAPGGR